jgi:hypothetical protein
VRQIQVQSPIKRNLAQSNHMSYVSYYSKKKSRFSGIISLVLHFINDEENTIVLNALLNQRAQSILIK